jgi:hypothetical protein
MFGPEFSISLFFVYFCLNFFFAYLFCFEFSRHGLQSSFIGTVRSFGFHGAMSFLFFFLVFLYVYFYWGLSDNNEVASPLINVSEQRSELKLVQDPTFTRELRTL